MRKLISIFTILSCCGMALPTNAVFTCTPDGFTLTRTTEGFTLYGAIQALMPNYGYDIGPVVADAESVGHTTLSVHAPGEGTPVKIDSLSINGSFPTTAPVSHLIITIDQRANPGPPQIECTQTGGHQ